MILRALFVIGFSALPVYAETPLTDEEFDKLTLGRVLVWSTDGTVTGIEQYLPDQRVRWTKDGKSCSLGRWYQKDQEICFSYDQDPAPLCWQITVSETGIKARDLAAAPDVPAMTLTEATETPACLAP